MTPKGGAYKAGAVTAWMLAALVAFSAPLSAQTASAGSEGGAPQAVSGILMLDWERLYERSAWGQRVAREIAQESAALNAENNRIADDLIAEEKALTERRAGMPSTEFRAAADAFDQRATGIRAAQKAKAQALSRRFEDERQSFVTAAVPLLDQILAERGAALVIDRRTVIRGLSQLDITDEMVTLADGELGDGAGRAEASAVERDDTAAPEATVPPDGAAEGGLDGTSVGGTPADGSAPATGTEPVPQSGAAPLPTGN